MELICKTQPKKATNITVDKKYNAKLFTSQMEETNDFENAEFAICVNDAGKAMRYNASLFAVQPQNPTYNDIIRNINISFRHVRTDNSILVFIGKINITVDNKVFFEDELTQYLIKHNSFSCGISILTGIDNWIDDDGDLDYIFNFLTINELNDLKRELKGFYYSKLLTAETLAILSHRSAMVIASTNDQSSAWDYMMTNANLVSNVVRNPNGGNNIATFTFYIDNN